MSDTSQGPGWWLASDGRWYPPETWAGPAQPGGYATATPYPSSSPYYGAHPGLARPTNGLAIASLICSCAGIIPFLLGIPCILGVIFGFVARSQIKRSNPGQEGAGLALAGIIVGFSLIAVFILLVAVIAAFGNFHSCTSFNNVRCSVD